MMLLSELAEKELIEMENGVRYGYLSETECIFDPKTGKILGFELIEPSRLPFQKKNQRRHYLFLGKKYISLGKTVFYFEKQRVQEGIMTNDERKMACNWNG